MLSHAAVPLIGLCRGVHLGVHGDRQSGTVQAGCQLVGGDDMSDPDMEAERPEPVVVPHAELSADALRGVIEAFVLREGTEYGSRDVELDAKVDAVLRQLDRKEAAIVFDPVSESIDIVVRRNLRNIAE